MKSGFWQWLSYGGLILAVWLAGRFLLPLVFPFLLGLGLALAAEPMVGFLSRRQVPRGLSAGIGVSMSFCFLGILLLLLGTLLLRQLKSLAGILPNLEQTAQDGLTLLQKWLLELTDSTPAGLQPLLRENVTGLFSDGTAFVEQAGRFLLSLAGGVLSRVPDSALTLGTAVISAFLFSAKLPAIRTWVKARFPRQRWERILAGAKGLRQALGGWLLAQLKLMGLTLTILLLGFWLLRIPYGPVWAVVVALVDALPVLGTGTVLIPWAAICLIQGDRARALGMAGLYLTISLSRSMLEPKLLGRHLGLDPLVTLVAMYAGYKLWGFPGLILAPMLAVTITQLTPKSREAEP